MGADLTYTCLGGNNYKLRLTFYRDCYGVAADISPMITVSSVSCGQSFTVYLDTVPGTGQEITPICPSATSTCNGGTFTGIEEWMYEGTITLPAQCTDWEFSYDLCCRNAAITTINTPDIEDIYIHSYLNNTITPCNNSPTFSNKPVPFVCLGQQFCFNHGAFDADGDSLAYTLITPLSTGGTNVTYMNPYTSMQPLNSSPPMSFDPLSGDFCATPQQIEVTVMAVMVSEYRNGVLIGQVERDMQITVIPCTNTLPSLTGINGTGNFTATICADAPFCFDIFSNDPDAGQNVSLTWDTSIVAGTFNTIGSPFPTGTFCWTPAQTDVSATAHCFTVRVWDNNCPYFGSQVYSYCLTVVNLTADAGPDQSVGCNNTVSITATAGGTPANYTYQWSNGSTAASQQVGTGTYTVTVSNGLCTATDEVTISPLSGPSAAFNVNALCTTLAGFTDQTTISTGNITGWSWDFGDGNSSSQQNPSHQYGATGTYTVCLVVSSDVGCTDTICQDVTVSNPPVAGFNANNVCEGNVIAINNTSAPAGSFGSYDWDFGDGTSSVQQNPSVLYNSSSNYTITLIVTDTLGCSDTVQQQVTVFPLPVASFNINYTGCESDQVSLTDNSTGNITSWSWDLGNGQSSNQQNPNLTYTPGTYDITLVVTTADGCVDSITQSQNIIPVLTVTPGPDQSICEGEQASISASGGISYLWSDGQSGDIISVNPGSTTLYTVTVTDANGCSDTTSVLVTVFQLPQLVPDPDQQICNGQSITLNVNGATSYLWSTGETASSITVSPSASASYSVTGTNNNGCSASAVINITVNEPPQISLPDISFCDGTGGQLDAGIGGLSYLWNNGQTIQTISVTQAGLFSVTVTDGNGCSDTAQATVTVFPLPQPVVTPDTAICNGETVTLTVNGATDYTWSTGQTSANITVSPASTTVYSVTCTDTNGCTQTASVNVIVNDPPVAIMQDISFCSGDNGILDAGISGMNYLWNNGQTAQSITVVQAGSYTVTVTDINGCFDTAQAAVTVYPLPQLITSPDQVICEGETISLTVNGASGYIWSTSETTSSISISPTSNTVYTVTGTDNNGCESSADVQVIVNSLPVLSLTDASICPGFTYLLDAGLSGVNYQWSTGETSQDITVSQGGLYTVTVTDANGCTGTAQAALTIFSQPNVSAGSDQDICKGENIVLTATGGVSFIWNTGDTTNAISISPMNNTSYSVIGTDINGCNDTAAVTVNVHNIPVLNIPNSLVCPGASTTLNAAHPGCTFLWSTGQTTQTIVVSQPGTYTVTVTTQWGCSASQAVQVAPGGSISNNTNTVTFCMGDSAMLDAGNPGNFYLWTPGGATTQTITVTTAGQYSVVITNSNGCSGAVNTTVMVNPLPQPGFSANGGCAGQPVNFTDTTNLASGTISQWSWDFGDGNYSLQQNPVHAYASSGSFVVTLSVTSDSGCTASFSQSINTASLPVANFSSNGACVFSPVQFSDGSSGGTITAWNWNFGDGTNSILQNPVHNYSLPGTYTATLTAITSNGCTDTKSKQVVIHELPEADFSASTVCLGFSTLFTDMSFDSTGNINSWNWIFGDGNSSLLSNPAHIYAQSGSFSVQLVVTSSYGCIDTAAHSITVNALPIANAGPDQALCQGQPVTLTVSGGNSWLWSTGQTTAGITVNPSATTFYLVTVTDANGCQDADTVMVGVGSVPLVSLADAFICTGNSVALNAGNPGCTYLWSTAETTQSVSVNSSGNYSVIVTNTAGCTGTAQATVTVGGSGLADNLNDLSVCPAQAATFNAGNPGNVFLWSTGATSQSIVATNAGTYTVTVTDTSGCAASFSAILTINPLPVPGFNSSVACQNDQTSFTNTSVIPSGNITSYLWNFGDGTTSQLQSPVHSYAATGNYMVTLTAISDMGCTDSISSPAVVYPLPAAAFTSSDECLYSPVSFADISSVLNDSISSWSWDFGDNIFSNQQNNSHQYNSAGSYQAVLVVTTINGCTDTAVQMVNVYAVPAAGFTAPSVCENVPVMFTDTSTLSAGNITSWNWSFGDNTSAGSQHPQHQYSNDGNYTVNLAVTSNNGCSDTVIRIVTVYPVPVAAFAVPDVCFGSSTQFTNQSSVPYGTITSAWNFGDGTSGTQPNPAHTYQVAGIFSVALTVTTNNNCAASATHPATVHHLPVAAFTAADVCSGLPAVFTDQSTSASGPIVSRSWDFGDGSSDTTLNPVHLYNSFGNYPVTLAVTSVHACSALYMDTVIIFRLPEPEISASNQCVYHPVTFTDISDTALTGTVAWHWDFGDGNNSAVSNPLHNYPVAGTYTVTLTTSTGNGCTASASMQIELYPVPHAVFTNTNVCAGNAVSFNNTSSISNGTIAGYQWFFGDSSAVNTALNPSHVYFVAGNYPVMLVATSNYGCRDTALGNTVIYANPVTNFVYNNDAGCGPLTIRFTDSSFVQGSTIYSWNWNFGDGHYDTIQNPVHVYANEGIYPVSLDITTADGCLGFLTIDKAIEIYPEPVADFTPDPYSATILQPVYFINHSTGASVYQWNFGDGTGSALENPQHLYNDTGRYVIYLVAINEYGCDDTSFNEVIMNPTFTVYIPNAFSPNHDGLNEMFTISGIGIKNYELFIWNRWGELVFKGTDCGWNGKSRNNDFAKEDVYVYRVMFTDIFNDRHKLDGRVSLIK